MRFGYSLHNNIIGYYGYEYNNKAFEKFINLCKSGDKILVHGCIEAKFDEEYNELIETPTLYGDRIKIRDCECYFDGKEWVLKSHDKCDNLIWSIRFEKQNNTLPKIIVILS